MHIKYPIISIITPCFNGGAYLLEAVESVQASAGSYRYEHLIINDGSTDKETLDIIARIENSYPNIVVLHQANKGASAARNSGCQIAQGKYLFFLDSDNKVLSDYISFSVNFLEKNSHVSVCYGKPKFIGDHSRGEFEPMEFDIDELLVSNYIDMCAIVRKETWERVGGFDESLPYYQDWDLWLSIYTVGGKFYYIDQISFEYRILETSIGGKSKNNLKKRKAVKATIYQKHALLYVDRFRYYYRFSLKIKKNGIYSFFASLYLKYKSL